MTGVMIGVDPHRASHTAVAAGADERPLGRVRVRASAVQARRLLEWAAPWPERSWAVEGAGGLGHLLAQQLAAAGERVLDVQPKLAARVRLLADEAVNKNDPNDARSIAVTALRSRTVREVTADDHCAVLKMWSRRQHDLGRNRTRIACRLHASLCGLVPGGRADEQVRETKKKLAAAVRATGTSLTEIFGVGPVIAATVIGETRDVSRFPSRDAFAACNGTAPVEVSSGRRTVCRLSRRGNRPINHAAHMTAVTQIRCPHSEGRAYFDKKLAGGTTAKEALRALKRQVSDAFYKHLKTDAARAARRIEGPAGHPGNDSVASAAGSHPRTPALRPGHSRTTTYLTTAATTTK